MSAEYRDRAVHRLEWVVATHRLPVPIAHAIAEALDAFRWDALREEVTDQALVDALRAREQREPR